VRALTASRAGRRAGFTLIEMMISTVVLAILLSAIGLTVLTGKQNFRQGVTEAVLESRARRAMDRIVAELQGAQASSIIPNPVLPLGSSSLQFRVCTGYNGTAQVWGPWMLISRVADPRDPQDGADNDSDGLVDEGRVVLTRDVGGANQQFTIVDGVTRYLQGEAAGGGDDNGNGLTDEAGLSFVGDANQTLTIRLSLAALDPRGRQLIQTVQTAVHMRN
jgi:prepilin-type N-terminal cleavage/methylation domain-containing protein